MTTPPQQPSAATVGPEAKEAARAISKTIQAYVSGGDPNFWEGLVERQLQAAITSATANLRRELEEIRANRLADQPNGNWLDRWGSCRVCGGEIPHGHTNECDIFKMEQTEHKLRTQLTASQNEERVLREALEEMTYAGSTGRLASAAHIKAASLLRDTTDLAAYCVIPRTELAELRRDKERLDWLNNRARFSFSLEEVDPMDIYDRTAREAIDSAATAKGRAL